MSSLGRFFESIQADRRKRVAAGIGAVLIGASAAALAATQVGRGENAATDFSSDPDTARIERIVHDYILEHPEILQEASRRLQAREVARVVEENRAALETPYAGAWAGAEDGNVVLVEFFDYACGYCRASNADVDRLLKEDGKLKVVWREWPVLGDDSIEAARLSLAAAKQGKFRDYHDRLFAAGRPTAPARAAVARALGIAAQPSSEVDGEIEKNFALARTLNATGTPVFIVGDKILHGAVGYQALKDAVAEARKRS